jgi:methionine-rich copper-binding protein CopC
VRNVVLLRGILVGLLTPVLLVGGLSSGPAGAHAALAGSDPEDGSTHAAAPLSVTFTFTENIAQPAYVAVTAPDGTQVAVSGIRAVDRTVTATVADVDQRGTYQASYRIVSADGNPVTGTVSYDVTVGRTVEQAAAASQDSFVHRHRSHFVWGILAAVVAIALLLAPLRRRHDSDTA